MPHGINSRRRRLLPAVLIAVTWLLPAHGIRAEPAIFWASDPVKPGQTVQMTGIDLAGFETVDITRVPDTSGSAVSGARAARPAQVLARSDDTFAFVVPAEMEPGVFSATLRGASRALVVPLNRPDIYWAQGDRGKAASPGGWLRVSGRNIALTGSAVVRLAASGRHDVEVEIEVERPDIWSATFPLPKNLSPATYRIRLWNGHGDASAWRDAGEIEVLPPASVDRAKMELSSTHPDNRTNDDTARINAALSALARRGGGELLLRAGIYRLGGPLTIPDGVSLKGESRDLVTLMWKDSENPPDALVSGFRDFSIADLTINADRHFHIIKGGFATDPTGADGGNITIRAVVIRASSFMGRLEPDEPGRRLEAMRQRTKTGAVGLLLAGSNIVVEDCDVLTSMRPFVLTRALGARLTGNRFHIGRRGWYSIAAPDGVLFENNHLIGADLQGSGGGINTLVGSSARNVLMRGNRFESMFAWDREAMTSDGPGGFYRGPIAMQADGRIRIDPAGLGTLKERNWQGAGLFVLKGRGLGAVARVTGRTDDLIALDRDLTDLTDGSSRVTIVPMQENFLIIDNAFEDVGSAQIFGTGHGHVFAGNRSLRSSGFAAVSLDYRHPQPNFYIQFLGNETLSAGFRRSAEIAAIGRQFKGNDTLLTFGLVIRDNRLRAASSIRVNGGSAAIPAVRGVLIEQNRIENTDIGIEVGPGVDELILRDNAMRHVQVPLKRP